MNKAIVLFTVFILTSCLGYNVFALSDVILISDFSPSDGETGVCPCCDGMCFTITDTFDNNMNISVYRSTDFGNIYGYNNSWCTSKGNIFTYRQSITIDHNFIDSDLSDFPILVNLSNNIVSIADNPGGNEYLGFYDGSCNELSHEIDYWDNSSYALVWVNVTSISSSVDTVLYVYYGGTGVVENPTGTWDSNFVFVSHMNDLTTSSIEDSTSNSNDGTKTGANNPNEVSGSIGYAQDFDGNDRIDLGSDSSLNDFENMTIYAHVNMDSGETAYNTILARYDDADNYFYYRINDDPGVYDYRQEVYTRKDAVGTGSTSTDSLFNHSEWVHLNLIMQNTSGNDRSFWLNEILKNDIDEDKVIATGGTTWIGDRGTGDRYFNGLIDEIRISNIARSQAWINATYDTINQTTGMISFSNQETNYGVIGQDILNEIEILTLNNVSSGTYCFCIDGSLNNSVYTPMMFNTTYYWYITATDTTFDVENSSDIISFTTAINISDCSTDNSDMVEYFDYGIIGLIGLLGLISTIFIIDKRR